MKVIIAGGRDFEDYEMVKKAIEQSGFDITEVVSGGAKGADSLGERWAGENGIPITKFPAKWNDLKAPGVAIRTNRWGKKYNANAGFDRNGDMAKYVGPEGGLIALPGGNGTKNMIKLANKHKVRVHVYQLQDEDYEYQF